MNKTNMQQLRTQGYTFKQIGGLYNLSKQRIHQILSGYKNNLRKSHTGMRNAVFARDSHKCQKCDSANNLIAHHIDKNSSNNIYNNLITLCSSCHRDIHSNGINNICSKCKISSKEPGCTYCRVCRKAYNLNYYHSNSGRILLKMRLAAEAKRISALNKSTPD